eukprot:TRINITY_DN8738_c0_g1_i1.p1 TRINITY_DN8738_c0_g1~~TRINITY_DN8738_c0_g1_i1.p1  ORF type:complete len:218 (+),score=43.43 TRINITY_DN8738_c0_g1_i1:50-703(+)
MPAYARAHYLISWFRAIRAYVLTVFRQFKWELFASLLGHSIPPSPYKMVITPQWLTEVLKKDGVLSKTGKVEQIQVRDVEGNLGMAATMKRLTVTYSGVSIIENIPPPPPSFIVKSHIFSFAGLRRNICSGNHREAVFYATPQFTSALLHAHQRKFISSSPNTIISTPSMKQTQSSLPKIYYSRGSRAFGEYFILMEDLKNQIGETVSVQMVFGNQC